MRENDRRGGYRLVCGPFGFNKTARLLLGRNVAGPIRARNGVNGTVGGSVAGRMLAVGLFLLSH